MRSQTTKVDKISKLNESFEIQPQKSTQLESLDPIVYPEVTSPFPPIINNEKNQYHAPTIYTYKHPPNPNSYSPPDINLLNSSLPYISHIGYIDSDYKIDDSTGLYTGTLHSSVINSSTVSMIPIINKSEYNIINRNDPDQILIMSDQDNIYPFGVGNTNTDYNKYKLSLISLLLASNIKKIKIPLYNDIRILYYAANSLLNDFTNMINNSKYSNYKNNISLLPLIKMIILAKNPKLDKSSILVTKLLDIAPIYVNNNGGISYTNVIDSTLPSLSSDRISVYNELFYYLDIYFQISNNLTKIDYVCFNFITPLHNLPTQLQNYSCKNVTELESPLLMQSKESDKKSELPSMELSKLISNISPGTMDNATSAGIGVGTILIIVIIIFILYYIFNRKSNNDKSEEDDYYSYDH